MPESAPDIAIFVEDPGAANFVARVPEELLNHGLSSRLYACGHAATQLSGLGQIYEPLPGGGDPGAFLADIAPRCVVAGTSENPDSPVLRMIQAAQRSAIVSVGVIDALMNAEIRFRGRTQDPLAFAPDWLLVPARPSLESFRFLGFRAERIVVTGHPHFDFLKEQRSRLEREGRQSVRLRTLPDVGADHQVLLFVTEGSARTKLQPRANVESYSLRGTSGGCGRSEIVLEELRESLGRTGLKPHVVLRIHPKDVAADYESFRDSFDDISSGGSPLELAYAADLVVGMTSMLMLEAAILGRPTLAILPRSVEADWLPTIGAGLTRAAVSRPEIDRALQEMLDESPSGPTANRVDELFPTGAASAVGKALARIASSPKIVGEG